MLVLHIFRDPFGCFSDEFYRANNRIDRARIFHELIKPMPRTNSDAFSAFSSMS